jgi:hypothetical protein
MAGESWYYTSSGQQYGPISLADLQTAIAAGQVSPQDFVWRDGMAEWQPTSAVLELQAPPMQSYPPAYQQPYAQYPHQYAAQGGYPYQQPLNYGGYIPPGRARRGAHYNKAMTGFVLSIIGFFCGNIFLGPAAIIMGIVALVGMKNGDSKGKGFAITAILLGLVDVAQFIVALMILSKDPNFLKGI